MSETAEGQDGDAAADADLPPLVEIVPDGDLLLDVTFEISKGTLRAAKKAARPRPGQQQQHTAAPALKPRTRTRYRVHLAVLKQNSKYFDNLLSDTRFAEARSIAAGLEQLSLRNISPAEASPLDLPLVSIHEDDEATQSADQAAIFADLLRILHRTQSTTTPAAKPPTMRYLAVLAVLADRFACAATVARYVSALKHKWPATQTRLAKDDGPALSLAAEETLRQKVLVAWLLDQPLKMQVATREMIMYGSRRWSVVGDEEGGGGDGVEGVGERKEFTAAWWDLPDDLEQELHHRRSCVLATLASVPRHFLSLYTSRVRQCKLGYDSSASCDSYQLGEMVKFLAGRDLLFFGDFSSSSAIASHRDYAAVDIGSILAALRQCPAYQIDKNHTNCGLRTRLLPALDFIQAMLSSAAVAVARPAWSKDRAAASWYLSQDEHEERSASLTGGAEDGGDPSVFRFTRRMATDQRLRHEGAMATDRIARALFTAGRWDWTPEDRDESRGVEFGRWRPADILK